VKRQVLVLGIGWFALQAIWTTYNAFMPQFYDGLTRRIDPVTGQLITNTFLVGLLMTTDNIVALALQPFWGARSDRTSSRLGRRLPYIVVGMPLAAIFTLLLPFFSQVALLPLVLAALCMNLSMTLFRAPMVSLFADLFPKGVRTQVSGATDLMAGMGAIVALLGGGALFDINPVYPFAMVAAILLIAAAVQRVGVKEPPLVESSAAERAGDLPPSVPAAVRTLVTLPQKSPLLMIVGVFFTWTAWNGVESLWTLFATRALGTSGGDAAEFAAILALSYLVGAVPAGFAAARFGRQRTMLAGLLLLIPVYIACAVNTSTIAYAVLLGIMGLFWSLVLVNGIILFQEFASPRQIGLFSGIYAIGTAVAQILGPPTYGFLMDRFGPHALWYTGIGALILGAGFISRVREGQVRVPDDGLEPQPALV
jgi:maltose/moltooligosaccharide transporter